MSFRKIQTSNIDTSEAAFSDPILILGKDNVGASDIGFLGKIGVNNYAGFVRDAETQTFYVIDGYIGAESSNQIEAVQITQKGNLTLGVLTADTIIAGNIPTQYTDALARASISATGSLSYDSTTGVISFTDSDSSYATLLGYNPADETDISSTVLNPGDAVTPATFRGDVINNSGTVIVDVSSTSVTFNGGLTGSVYGSVYDRTGATLIIEDDATPGPIVHANLDGNVTGNTAGTHTGNVIGSLNGNVTGRLYGDVHGDVTSPTSLEPIITTGPVRDTLTIHDAHIDKIKAPGTNGATILNTSGATTLSGHNVQLTGSLYGDIGDTLANNPVLTVGTGNNDSQLAVTVASIDELTVNDSIDVTNATITGLDISDLTDANNVIQPSDLSTYSTTTASNLFAQQQDLIAKTAAIAAANSYTNGQITTVTSTLQNYANAPTTWVAPKGTEANRPASPVEGQFYFNTDTKIFEGYNGTSWIQLVPSTLLITP